MWWHCFWNGLSMMLDDRKANPDILTSGSWGYRAFWDDVWLQFEWLEALSSFHITNKEPIVLAAAT